MTNGLPEIAFVGKAPGTYLMLLGGGYYGQRLNKIYRGQSDPVLLANTIHRVLRRERDGA
jgi:sulfite reductase beta subunit-like hemoprotein